MTANELADWIENGAPFGDYETAKQAAAMLRQQQATIDELNNPIFKAISLAFTELTDEEILLLSKQVPLDADTHDLLLFARAIIKKVGGG